MSPVEGCSILFLENNITDFWNIDSEYVFNAFRKDNLVYGLVVYNEKAHSKAKRT